MKECGYVVALPSFTRMPMRRTSQRLRLSRWATIALVLCAFFPVPTAEPETPSPAQSEPTEAAPEGERAPSAANEPHDEKPMGERFARWLEEVEPLISRAERALYVSLKRDYQREAFIQQFWRVRDPYPRTARNELKERWPIRLAEARNRYESMEDDRSRVYLIHGEPDGGFKVRCTKKHIPAEVWTYSRSDQVDFPFMLVFIKARMGSLARVWRPGQTVFAFEKVLARFQSCLNGAQLGQVVGFILSDPQTYDSRVQAVLAKPRPRSQEWLLTFAAQTTDLPETAEPMDGTLDIAFPGRHQHRTVVQGLIRIPKSQPTLTNFAGYRSYDFKLTGEVLQGDSLFESFRYKFGFPGEQIDQEIPLAFQRYLRPGSYKLILRLDDLNSARVFRTVHILEVPAIDKLLEQSTFHDPETAQLFAEATAALEAGETSIRLIPPRGELQTGFVRFDTLVSGEQIEKVRFFLDRKLLLTKNRPPYNVEIDLGPYPDLHTLRVEALDSEGREVANDEVLLNSGGYRFHVKLREPRPGRTYTQSLQARIEVEIPEGRELDKVEIYLNETLVATLYQEPFVQPILLPSTIDLAYVRAVAYLPDGNSTEDLVFINSPDYLEELEIQFVELYTSALDRNGRPVDGLRKESFSVSEDGVQQTIARFERVEDLPIHIGILIDNSASMVGTLDEVRKAALSFFEQAVSPKDRAAVITFNRFPHLAVKLTNDRRELGSGLAGLTAEGQTALYDSVMFGLYYFTGIKGQRAILVLSDGRDESSRFGFEETLEYARRAGITIYSIGLRLGPGPARQKLSKLADETGGRSFFIEDIQALGKIYGTIQQELRSQYLIAYQSSNTDDDRGFRAVTLEVDRPGVTVKSLSGYYP